MRQLLALAVLSGLVLPTAALAQIREVIVTFKTHFDIGYTEMAADVVKRYRTTMIDQALNVTDQNRDLPAFAPASLVFSEPSKGNQ